MSVWILALMELLAVGNINAGINQWTTNGPSGRSVFALAVDPKMPTTVYAGTDQGVFKSIDSGGSWNRTSLEAGQVKTLVIDPVNPAVLYAGTTQGMFKSVDGGINWQARNQGLRITTFAIHTIAIDPLTPTTIYTITADRIFKSLNGGTNWGEISANLEDGDVITFAIDPQNPQILYAGTTKVVPVPFFGTRDAGGIFRSADGGGTWTRTSLPIAPALLTIAPQSPTTLY